MIPGYYETTVEPASEPVTLSEAKSFLRVENSDDDTLITALIVAARLQAEKYMSRRIVTRTRRVSFVQSDGLCNVIKDAPVTSLSSVETWNDVSDAFEALSDYSFMPGNSFPAVLYKQAIQPVEDNPYAIRITYQVGYSSIPEDMKLGIKQHVNFLYENRGDTEALGKEQIPGVAKFLYRQYRIIPGYV